MAARTAGAKPPARQRAATAAMTVESGGGPDNPVTDALAVSQATGRSTGAAAKQGSDALGKATGGGRKTPTRSRARRGLSWAWSDNRKLLVAEFIACIVVLGLGTLTAEEGSKDDVGRAMVKGSALAGMFFVLSLVAAGGKGPARAANAVGTLVTAAYVLTSSDVHNLVSFVAGFFSKTSGRVKAQENTATSSAAATSGAGQDVMQV